VRVTTGSIAKNVILCYSVFTLSIHTFEKEIDMQYLKNLFLGLIVIVFIGGCSGFTLEIPLNFSAGVILPEPEPQPVVYWYQTTPACCYVFISRGWIWDYHHWHHHHHQGHPHYGYAPRSPVPRQYMRPPTR